MKDAPVYRSRSGECTAVQSGQNPLYWRAEAVKRQPLMRFPRGSRSIQAGFGTAMTLLAWLTLLLLLGFFFNDLLERQQNPNRAPESRVLEGGVREVVLGRNKWGHYVTHGEINGESVVFMIDTGATGVAIPAAVGMDLGLPLGKAFSTQTANGIATAYATRLDSVSVGDIELRDVRASISPGLQTQEILLGMSFLRYIEFTQRGHTLVLRQYVDG